MKLSPAFSHDIVDLLREQTHGKAVSRRRFLHAAAILGVSPALFSFRPAGAQNPEIVVVNWGGDAVTAMETAFANPFNSESGGPVAVIEGDGPSSAKIKAMVESGAVVWDVCDRNIPASIELGRQGLLEEIDYSIVDASKLRPEHVGQWGAGSYLFSFALTYWTDAWEGRLPETWADFWDLESFPGTRTLRRHIDGQLEAALIADGVAPDALYPLDVDRALAKILEIKENTIFWGSGSESQQVFRDRAVVMGNLFSTRASVLRAESDRAIDFTFNQASVWPGAWIVPKGAPAGKAVFEFIRSTQEPERQVELLALLGNGPINPAAAAMVPDELKAVDPGSPENYAKQIPADAEWYATNSASVLTRFIEAIA